MTITAEFETNCFPVSERATAERQAELLLRGAQRAEHDLNVSRPTLKVGKPRVVEGYS